MEFDVPLEDGQWTKTAFAIGVDVLSLADIKRRKIENKNGADYVLIYNPNRQNRPVQKKPTKPNQVKECNMCNETKRWEEKHDNMIFEEYADHLVCPNLHPIDLGHVVIIHRDCDKKRISSWDLKEMSRLHQEHNYSVWRNMRGAASTIPHDHFQGLPFMFPIQDLDLEQISEEQAVMKNYPGANFVFNGKNRAARAEQLIGKLDEQKLAYTIDISENISIFPMRAYQGKGGMGGAETGGIFVANTQDEYNGADSAYLENKLKQALFSPGELYCFYD